MLWTFPDRLCAFAGHCARQPRSTPALPPWGKKRRLHGAQRRLVPSSDRVAPLIYWTDLFKRVPRPSSTGEPIFSLPRSSSSFTHPRPPPPPVSCHVAIPQRPHCIVN